MNTTNQNSITITKEKITSMLKSKVGFSGMVCEEIVNQIFNQMQVILKSEQKLVLQKFGSFSINNKKARPGQNLQTKTQIIIEPRSVISFSPAKYLKNIINDHHELK
ncbi:HU family DNA-binding protein [Candidatus Trichorickettsia mobilis]|uniref:HU family DNA-binding protein n=1 Tax=Candidatus Trichorickettsia mobilis TaxID=1346319 RepID=UPI0037427555